ncbi:TetR/AcrR family transcriptional regulator [Luteibacter yeojuensis]|nr:TetR/AcrR family transcriptional regulator [Luteibacter yeojuensis]
METPAGKNSRDTILEAATRMAQAHGYGGLNLRTLADLVGIKAASLYHHFPSKADLATAVARRYWEDAAAGLDAIAAKVADPAERLRKFPGTFRLALENDNRMCMCSYMTAESDDLPGIVKVEIERFNEVNIAWLAKTLVETGVPTRDARKRAHAIFAAVAGAQLMARGRGDVKVYDTLIRAYQASGLIPS